MIADTAHTANRPATDKATSLLFGINIAIQVAILSLLAFVSVQVSSGQRRIQQQIDAAEARVKESFAHPALEKIGEGLEKIGEKIPEPNQ